MRIFACGLREVSSEFCSFFFFFFFFFCFFFFFFFFFLFFSFFSFFLHIQRTTRRTKRRRAKRRTRVPRRTRRTRRRVRRKRRRRRERNLVLLLLLPRFLQSLPDCLLSERSSFRTRVFFSFLFFFFFEFESLFSVPHFSSFVFPEHYSRRACQVEMEFAFEIFLIFDVWFFHQRDSGQSRQSDHRSGRQGELVFLLRCSVSSLWT